MIVQQRRKKIMATFGEFASISEGALRLGAFAGIFAVMALLELLIPKRRLDHKKSQRWFTNIAIGGVDSVIVRLMSLFVIPLAAVAAALWLETKGWGLMYLVSWPDWVEILLAVIVLDMAIYWQHVASHKIPMLWDFHKMHHSDVDFDVTTAIRFHPVEIALSMLYKIVLVFILGPSAIAVVIFEIVLNGCAMFNHSNVAFPRWFDAILRLVLVTPDMHRVHHSIIHSEHDTNYGFNLSVWDRIFRSYTAQPEKGHLDMTIGLKTYQSEAPTGLAWSLTLPFRKSPGREAE